MGQGAVWALVVVAGGESAQEGLSWPRSAGWTGWAASHFLRSLSDKQLHAHYFVGGCDWYVAELSPGDGDAFGYADLGHGEWRFFNPSRWRASSSGRSSSAS